MGGASLKSQDETVYVNKGCWNPKKHGESGSNKKKEK